MNVRSIPVFTSENIHLLKSIFKNCNTQSYNIAEIQLKMQKKNNKNKPNNI